MEAGLWEKDHLHMRDISQHLTSLSESLDPSGSRDSPPWNAEAQGLRWDLYRPPRGGRLEVDITHVL